MKFNFKWMIVVLIIVGYYILSARSDYIWADRYISGLNNSWIVFSQQQNAADLIHFYTLIKTPISRIGIIKKSSLVKRPDGSIYIEEVWANKEFGGGVTEEAFQFLLDCVNKREGWMEEGDKSENVTDPYISPGKIKWSSFSIPQQELPCKALENYI